MGSTLFIKNEIAFGLLFFLFLIFILVLIKGRIINLTRFIGVISNEMREVLKGINSITANIIYKVSKMKEIKSDDCEDKAKHVEDVNFNIEVANLTLKDLSKTIEKEKDQNNK